MAYTLLDGPDATARTPLLIIFAAVLASIAITLSGVSVRGVDKANDRIDNVYLHMQSASAAQSTESSPSVKYIEAQPQVDQSSYLRHIAQTTYSRASTLLTAHPVCRDSPDAYATCMDTLSASEHLMAHQVILFTFRPHPHFGVDYC